MDWMTVDGSLEPVDPMYAIIRLNDTPSAPLLLGFHGIALVHAVCPGRSPL